MWHDWKRQKSSWMDLVVSSWKDCLRGNWDRQCLQTKLESKLWGGTRKDTSGSGLRQNFLRGTANYPGALWICFICLPRREDILERSECNGDEMGSFGRRSDTNSQPPFRDFFARLTKQVPSLQLTEDRHLHSHVQPSGNVSFQHLNGPPAPQLLCWEEFRVRKHKQPNNNATVFHRAIRTHR